MLLALLKVMSAYAGLMTNARVSIQTQSLALRALRKRKPQETQAIAIEWKPGLSHLRADWLGTGICSGLNACIIVISRLIDKNVKD